MNIIEFIEYFDEKKKELIQTEEKIKNLQSESEQLEPIVKVNREIIDIIINKQLMKQQEQYEKNRWIDTIIGLIIGIFSSLIAGLISFIITKKKS